MMMSISDDKLDEYRTTIFDFLTHDSCTLKMLQRVIGQLQWTCNIIPQGRPYLRHLIDSTCHIKSPFQQIRISQGMRKDLEMWLTFFENYNGGTMFMTGRTCILLNVTFSRMLVI